MRPAMIATLSEMLARRHWLPFQQAASHALDNGLRPQWLLALDPILEIHAAGSRLDDDLITVAVRGEVPVLQGALRALRQIDPSSPLIQQLADAMYRLTNMIPKPLRKKRTSNCLLSLPFEQWPTACRDLFDSLPTVDGGRFGRLSAKTLSTVRNVIGQVLLSAQNYSVTEPTLTLETFRFWLEDAENRKILHRSRANYIRQMITFVFHTSQDEELLAVLEDERERHIRLGRKEPSKKKTRQHADGIPSRADLLKTAERLMAEAPLQRDIRMTRLYYRGAAFFGLLAYCPTRVLDCVLIQSGTHLSRSEQGWFINYHLSKTREHLLGYLPDKVTRYLDCGVCFGGMQAGEEVFWRHYNNGYGKPFFRHPDGRPLTTETFQSLCRRFLGRPVHDLRSTPHDDLAVFGEAGRDGALVMCGQASPKTAEHYEVRAAEIRMTIAGNMLRDQVEDIVAAAQSERGSTGDQKRPHIMAKSADLVPKDLQDANPQDGEYPRHPASVTRYSLSRSKQPFHRRGKCSDRHQSRRHNRQKTLKCSRLRDGFPPPP